VNTVRVTKKRRWRFRGITSDAIVLGVNRGSLYQALAFKRPNKSGKSLRKLYRQLKAAQRAAAKTTAIQENDK
jgi:hypothetical protein